MTGSLGRAVRFVCAAWILPAGFSLIAFFGFFTNYTTDVFSSAGLAAQYQRSVFQYRLLGRYLVSTLATVFEPRSSEWEMPRAMAVLDPSGNAGTYWAYVVVHTLATCIGCSILLLTLRHACGGQPTRGGKPLGLPVRRVDQSSGLSIEPELIVVAVSMLVALAAFVVTPYDGVFFAFQMAALWVTLVLPASAVLAPLAVITVLAALTRETAYFIPAFFLAAHHRAILAGDRPARTALAASATAVVATYIGLRAVIGWSGASSVFYAWQWESSLKWTSLTGSIMLLASVTLLLSEGRNQRPRVWFAALSLPYLVFVHLFAEPWEWRLWVPVLVPLIVLRVWPELGNRDQVRQTG